VYNQQREQIDPPEREAIMTLTNEWIEEGRAEGRAEGRDEGRREEREAHRLHNQRVARELITLKQINAPLLLNRLDQLDGAQLQQLVDRLLDSSVRFEPESWLKKIDQE